MVEYSERKYYSGFYYNGKSYFRFWSVVLFHPNCMDTLISFLQEASPPYEPPHKINEVNIIYEEIRRLVLVIFSRLITNKESEVIMSDYIL